MARPPGSGPPRPAFLFAACQVGAERALKSEVARLWPDFHFAFSRPGFLTFKLPDNHNLSDDFDPRLTFARAHGFSLDRVTGESLQLRAQQAWQIASGLPCDALHVWQRDLVPVGYRGFEPHTTAAARAAEAAILEQRPNLGESSTPLVRVARPGQFVLDCVLVEPEQWYVGYHRASDHTTCLAGGVEEIAQGDDVASRAYLKMEEALRWSGLPIRAGDRFVEVGCAPGGASQALLNRGLRVIGIDPAQVDPRVLAHPGFTHIQKRGAEVRRRLLRNARWLAADMNVAPCVTLDTVEALVTHPALNIRGLLLTLKLPEWDLAEQIPGYLRRISDWGYAHVRARQLAHNRQEFCVVALRRKRSRGV